MISTVAPKLTQGSRNIQVNSLFQRSQSEERTTTIKQATSSTYLSFLTTREVTEATTTTTPSAIEPTPINTTAATSAATSTATPAITTMNEEMVGPDIRPLPPGTPYDPRIISEYITSVLQAVDKQHAYGILAGVSGRGGSIVPTIIFGIPESNICENDLPPAPDMLPILIRDDCVISINGYEAMWSMDPVYNANEIVLEPLSVGIEGSLSSGGSFGGFLRRLCNPGKIFGITAAHCIPGGLVGMPMCAPSTLEATSRFQRLLRYTTLTVPSDWLRFSRQKQNEAQNLLQQFKVQTHTSGLDFLDPRNQYRPIKGVLSGESLGAVFAYRFGAHESLLYDYDKELAKRDRATFSAERSWKTRLDWCIFSCKPNRYGGNIYQGLRIDEIGDLFPGATVEKVGRSTGSKTGRVNAAMLQHWNNGESTYEITIIGDTPIFATVGDSGGCVFLTEEENYRAAGILVGMNRDSRMVFATPLRAILDLEEEYEWA